MPITIKTATMQYKNASGQYVGVDAVAEATTSAQVAAVEAAGAEQANALEEKGAEIIADWPQDYSTLTSDVSDLKSAVNHVEIRAPAPSMIKSVNNNYLDIADINITGKYFNPNTGAQQNLASCNCGYIKIPFPGNYVVYSSKGLLGSNAIKVPLFDENKSYIMTVTGTELSNRWISVSFTSEMLNKAVYIGITELTSDNVKPMLLSGSTLPTVSNYVAPSYDGVNSRDVKSDKALGDEHGQIFAASVNLFDQNNSKNRVGIYYHKDSALLCSINSLASAIVSHPIFLTPGTYKFSASASTFGSGSASVICICNLNGDPLKYILGTYSSSDGTVTFETDECCFVSFNMTTSTIFSAMFCRAENWPESYVAYSRKINNDLLLIGKDNADFLTRNASVNLLDLSDLIYSKYFEPNNGSLTTFTNRPIVSVYVKLDGAGSYSTRVTKRIYGTAAAKLALFDSGKTYVSTVTGTLGESDDNKSVPLSFDVTAEDIESGAT